MSPSVHQESVRVPFRGGEIAVCEARPESASRAPAVLVVHEWWGLNDHIRDITRRLAREGFRALAPDLYDGRTTHDAGEAGRLMAGLDPQEALGKLQAGLDWAGAGSGEAGVVGFCMGGGLALALAARDERIGAAVPFYGQVPGDDVLEGLRGGVLFFAAGRDPWITLDETERLAAYIRQSGLPGEVVRYEDADHAFFNDTRPEVYRQDLAAEAWTRATDFLREHLVGGR